MGEHPYRPIPAPPRLRWTVVARPWFWRALWSFVGSAAACCYINRALGWIVFPWSFGGLVPLCLAGLRFVRVPVDPTAAEKLRPLREVDRRPHPMIPSPDEWRRVVVALEASPVPDTCRTEDTQRWHRENARGAALLVAVAVSSGLRLDELRHLRPEDVAGDRVEVRASGGWSPKSWAERTVPVGPEARELARELVTWMRSRRAGVRRFYR